VELGAVVVRGTVSGVDVATAVAGGCARDAAVGRRRALDAGEPPMGQPKTRAPGATPLSEQIAQLRVKLELLETGATAEPV
jgi:hypothetical protein